MQTLRVFRSFVKLHWHYPVRDPKRQAIRVLVLFVLITIALW